VECEVCGRPAEQHHIVFRSAAAYMLKVKVNHKYLCNEHHTGGRDSPHKNRQVDLKYKLEMQNKLYKILPNTFYTEKILKDILEVSNGEIRTLVKPLSLYKEGYSKEDIIRRCMGGKLYSE
jgi:hypothetical protein